jgi:hypothetical protein
VNLAGGGWPSHFYAGGEIYRAGADTAKVELRFANGVTLSDDADADVVLFITESAVQLPATAALLDPAGERDPQRDGVPVAPYPRISQLQTCPGDVRAEVKADHAGSLIGATARCRRRLTAAGRKARLDR